MSKYPLHLFRLTFPIFARKENFIRYGLVLFYCNLFVYSSGGRWPGVDPGRMEFQVTLVKTIHSCKTELLKERDFAASRQTGSLLRSGESDVETHAGFSSARLCLRPPLRREEPCSKRAHRSEGRRVSEAEGPP